MRSWVAALGVTLMALAAPAAANAASCAEVKATIVGTNGPDRLVGTAGRDVIQAFGGRDVIRGFQGNDWICGGRGADVVHGGPGRDFLFGGPRSQLSRPGAAEDGPDVIYGGPGGDYIEDGRGRDRVFAGLGPDHVIPSYNPGPDLYRLGPGADTVNGAAPGANLFYGGRGNDNFSLGPTGDPPNAGVDVYRGGLGRDILVWAGELTPFFADLNTGLAGDSDHLDKVSSVEVVVGEEGNDTLIGNDLDNWLDGFLGNDHIEGRGGDDFLDGGSAAGDPGGDDFLDGGDGTDTLDGRDGTDECRAGETVLNCETVFP